jgi:hypothetical protein
VRRRKRHGDQGFRVVGPVGIEPTTFGSKVRAAPFPDLGKCSKSPTDIEFLRFSRSHRLVWIRSG